VEMQRYMKCLNVISFGKGLVNYDRFLLPLIHVRL
jgi:hypothetical protein